MTASVDVVIAARNAERFIAEALESALEQTMAPRTVIVVDDGSSDATVAVARSLDARVTVIESHQRGVGPARNAGIAASTSEVIALLDADDVWMPQKLERQMAALRDDASIGAVFCLFDEFHDEHDGPLVGVRPAHLGAHAALASGALLRREVVDRIGPFERADSGDWLAWWGRARSLEVHEFHVQEVLFRRRIHGNNSSLTRHNSTTFLAVLRDHLRERPSMR